MKGGGGLSESQGLLAAKKGDTWVRDTDGANPNHATTMTNAAIAISTEETERAQIENFSSRRASAGGVNPTQFLQKN